MTVRERGRASPPDDGRSAFSWWHAGGVVLLTTAGLLNMWGWFSTDILPPYDFAGYASVVEDVRRSLMEYGRLPAWSPHWFAGTTRFVGNLKELLAFPLASWLGPVRGTEATILMLKVLAGLAMYAFCQRAFRAPAAGLVAGYAFAFGNAGNYASEHFHVIVSYVIFALVCIAGTELVRSRRLVSALALGVLVALQVANNPVHVPACLLFVGLVALLSPSRPLPPAEPPRAVPRRIPEGSLTAMLGVALVVSAALAAADLAWLVADRAHHPTHGQDYAGWGATAYIEHSPFVYLNRADWLRGWLTAHHPPDMPLFPQDPQRLERHYLGFVPIVVCIVGWFAARKDRTLRRWSQVFAILFLVQYWLSMGSRTLAWLVARSFHWPESTDPAVRLGLTMVAVVALVCAGIMAIRQHRARSSDRALAGAHVTSGVELALGVAFISLLASRSLYDAVRTVFPPLGGLRSPGHFFELAPFAFYALFAVLLIAIVRRLPGDGSPRVRTRAAVLAIVGVLVVVDFWPSTRCFSRGTPLAPVRELRREIVRVPSDAGGLRVALYPWSPSAWSSPTAWTTPSLAIASASAGGAWSWLPWQSTVDWPIYARAAMLWLNDDLDAGERRIYRPVGDALSQIGRFKYFIDEFHAGRRLDLGAPWSRRFENERFALWERPDVMPAAYGYRSYVVLVGADEPTAVRAVSYAFTDRVLAVTGGDPPADGTEAILGGAGRVLLFGDAAATGAWGGRYRDITSIVQAGQFLAVWPEVLRALQARTETAPELLDVAYRRPAPEHITLDIDAGTRPAVAFVAEAYHPWWRAHVDGRAVPLVRAHLAFMAVPVDPGSHTIELRFTPPPTVRAADWLTAFAWLVLAAAVVGVPTLRAVRRARS